MPLRRQVAVNGAAYNLVEPPKYSARLSRYTAMVEHADGRHQIVYSRFPEGPFVFTIPSEKEPHP